MEKINRQAIIEKTHYGLKIYSHILRLYYPEETVLALSGRTCSLTKNPFNDNNVSLQISIEKITGETEIALQDEIAVHNDVQNAIPDGDVFDFAELHYKLSGTELLDAINKDMKLRIGEKISFYKNNPIENAVADEVQKQIKVTETQYEFSFFKAPIRNINPFKVVTIVDAYHYIAGHYASERTNLLRNIIEKVEKNEATKTDVRNFKADNFDYCTFSGVFTSRSDKNLEKHSGLICLDFDNLSQTSNFSGKDGLELLKNALLDDDYFDTELMFISPSGDGLKWIIQIDTDKYSHSEFFDAFFNYVRITYELEIDKACRDVSRACFLPHDPNVFINPKLLQQNDNL